MNDKLTADEVFAHYFNRKGNFMTPYTKGFGETDAHFYELSEGKFMNKPMYGVTVIAKGRVDGMSHKYVKGETFTHDHARSQSFATLEEAREYIAGIKEFGY